MPIVVANYSQRIFTLIENNNFSIFIISNFFFNRKMFLLNQSKDTLKWLDTSISRSSGSLYYKEKRTNNLNMTFYEDVRYVREHGVLSNHQIK